MSQIALTLIATGLVVTTTTTGGAAHAAPYQERPPSAQVGSSNAAPTIDNTHLYNGGFPCAQVSPYPRIGALVHTLQALGSDADETDRNELTLEVALWPVDDATARTVLADSNGPAGWVTTVMVPDGTLVDGTSYGWQARFGDGEDTSEWSKECFFTYDNTRPSAPAVSSSNYPAYGSGTWAPPGVPGVFTFSGHGDRDVAGFQYSWDALGLNSCSWGGGIGRLVCEDSFGAPDRIRADTPGGTATVALHPVGAGPRRLTVRSIDTAGNVSASVVYDTNVPYTNPQLVVQNGKPRWGQEILLKFLPAQGVTGIREYEIVLDNGEPVTREADEDGTAYFSFVASNPNGHKLTVRSRSANGFVSLETFWSVYFD